jgi:hypothetical protein
MHVDMCNISRWQEGDFVVHVTGKPVVLCDFWLARPGRCTWLEEVDNNYC